VLEDARGVSKDVVVPESQYTIALSCEVTASSRIAIVSERVVPTVQFYDHPRFSAAEIRDERTEGVLPTELEAFQASVAQQQPEFSLRGCL